MLVISKYQMLKQKGIIPYLSRIPDYQVSVTTEDYNDTTNYVKVKYTWRSKHLITLCYKHQRTSELIYELNCSECTWETAIEAGLITRRGYNWETIYDALYYEANEYPLKLASKSYDQLCKLAKRINTRLSKSYITSYQKFTNKVVHEFMTFISQTSLVADDNFNIEDHYNYMTATQATARTLGISPSNVRWNIVTRKWTDSESSTSFRTRLGNMYKPRDHYDDLSAFNLTHVHIGSFARDAWINQDTEVVVDGSIYLRSEVNMTTCNHCGREVQARHIIEGEGCTHCVADRSKIHGYSTKVPDLLKFKAKKVKPTTLYLGVELEYESDSESERTKDAVFANTKLKGHAILKSDGSIRCGFEIVTCPATLDIHLDEFKTFFAEYKEKTKLHSASNTGMHVHISRKPLNMLTIGKMTAFLNKRENKSFIEAIAGRTLNSYCRQDESRTVSYPLVYGSGDRYNTLNLNNSGTVEIRIFSTPDTYQDFASKLEFSEALALYCSPCAANFSVYKLLETSNFVNWVLQRRKDYPHLSTKLKSIQG